MNRQILHPIALLALSLLTGASCAGESTTGDAVPPPPSYLPEDIPAKLTDAFYKNSGYSPGWWDTLFPRPYKTVNTGVGFKGLYKLATPDDFYTYVGRKLAQLNGGNRNVGFTQKHADWIEERFTRMLPKEAKVWQEPFQFLGHTANLKGSSFSYTAKGGKPVSPTFEIFDGSAAGTCKGPLVAVDNDLLQKAATGGPADLAAVKAKVAGGIAVVDRHPTFHRSSQARVLGLAGACAMLYISKSGPRIQTGSARTFFEPMVALPTITISDDNGKALRAAMKKGITAVGLTVAAAQDPNAKGGSVVAWLPGRTANGEVSKEPGKQDAVILGAHFDAFHEGFADNAGGVAMLMAVTRQLGIDYSGNGTSTKNIDDGEISGCVDCKPEAGVDNPNPGVVVRDLSAKANPKRAMPDIYLVAYDGEEIGLFGGYAFMLNHVEELIKDRFKLMIHFETPRGKSAGISDVVGSSAGVETGSRFLFQATDNMASLDVAYNDTFKTILPTNHVTGAQLYAGSAPFRARGNIFDIIRKFGGILPTDLQGFYRSQVPCIATASEPETYHTVADTVANEYESTVESFNPLLGGLSTWRPHWLSIPFKTKALYDALLAYLDYYAGKWPAATYGVGAASLTPTLEAARLAVRSSADPAGADPPAVTCDLTGGSCKIIVSVKNAGATTINSYDAYLMFSNTAAVKVGFTADDPANPAKPQFPGRDPLFPNLVPKGADAAATIEITKAQLQEFSGAKPTRFHPWLLIVGKGTVAKIKFNGPLAEMVRPLVIKCAMPGPGCGGAGGGGGAGGMGGAPTSSSASSSGLGGFGSSGFGGGFASSGFSSSGFGSSSFGSSSVGGGFGSSSFGGGFGSSGFGGAPASSSSSGAAGAGGVGGTGGTAGAGGLPVLDAGVLDASVHDASVLDAGLLDASVEAGVSQ